MFQASIVLVTVCALLCCPCVCSWPTVVLPAGAGSDAAVGVVGLRSLGPATMMAPSGEDVATAPPGPPSDAPRWVTECLNLDCLVSIG